MNKIKENEKVDTLVRNEAEMREFLLGMDWSNGAWFYDVWKLVQKHRARGIDYQTMVEFLDSGVSNIILNADYPEPEPEGQTADDNVENITAGLNSEEPNIEILIAIAKKLEDIHGDVKHIKGCCEQVRIHSLSKLE